MPGILALDQATILGWAAATPGSQPVWGSIRLGRRGAESGEVGAFFWRWLEDKCAVWVPDFIVYETPYVPASVKGADEQGEAGRVPTNAQTMRKLLGLAWEIDTFADLHEIECREISGISAIKKLTGRGRFYCEICTHRLKPLKGCIKCRAEKKRATMAACAARGWTADENAADALALLLFAEMQLYPREALTRPRTYRVPEGPLLAVDSSHKVPHDPS